MGTQRIVAAAAVIGKLYWDPAVGLRGDRTLREIAEAGWKDVLADFVHDYAYERAIRVGAYPEAAAAAVRAYGPRMPRPDMPKVLWDEFRNELGSVKPNPRLDVMSPDRGIAGLVGELRQDDFNILTWIRRAVSEEGWPPVYERLRAVRGVGEKIAAFYLRDVAYAFELPEPRPEEARYVQPIDRWTGWAAAVLAGNPTPSSNRAKADLLQRLATASGVSGAELNAGLWFLGAEVLESEDRFRQVLADESQLAEALDNHAARSTALAQGFRASQASLRAAGSTADRAMRSKNARV